MPGDMASSRQEGKTGQAHGRTRADRLKAALRQNLKRRKAQAAARQESEAKRATNSHDSAGFVHEIEPHKPNR
jgi:hypothetical protein